MGCRSLQSGLGSDGSSVLGPSPRHGHLQPALASPRGAAEPEKALETHCDHAHKNKNNDNNLKKASPNSPNRSLFLSLQSGVFHGLLQEAQGSTGTKDANR